MRVRVEGTGDEEPRRPRALDQALLPLRLNDEEREIGKGMKQPDEVI